MNRCSSSHGSSYGPCSCCGFYQAPTNSFSMFFMDDVDQHGYPYTSPSSSSVDCTLSLGTPSTRQSTSYNFMDHQQSSSSNHHRASPSSSSGSKKLSWDIFQSKKSSSASKSNRGGNGCNGNGNSNNNLNGDSLLARRCANCDTTSTPLWRNGPRGPKSLCNACGIRYKKEERRAANSSSTSTTSSNATASSTIMDSHHYMGHHHMNTWGHQGNEFRFIEDNDGDSTDTTAIPFLSWRLNVPVHDYS